FKCKLSLEKLRSTSEYKRADYQELLADNGVVGRDYQLSFQRERQRFNSSANFEWYVNGQITIVQDQHQLWELATRVMQTIFSATPAHKTAQHLAKGSNNAPKQREALDHILSAPFQRSGKKSSTDIILFDGAAELGLIFLVGQEGGYSRYDVCVPDPNLHQQSRVIWDMFDEQLKARDAAVAWLEISEELARPPFGLSPQVIELFLAAFLRFNKDCVEVYTTKKGLSPQIDVTEDIIIKMIESPKDYIIQYKLVTNQQEHLLHAKESIGDARHAADSQAQRTSFATYEETRNKPIVPSTSMVSVESKPSLASTSAISSPSQAQQLVTDVTTEGAPTTRAIHRQTGTISRIDQEAEQIPTDSAISASSQPKDSAETRFATSSSYQIAIPPMAKHPTEDQSHLYKTYTIEDTEEEDWDKAPVEQAFNIIRAIFDGLTPKDQRKLCIRVVEEYNSR
ncbi:MAG TPA: hypothetical protein VGL94_07800, partial [Ktedonobacteraceae bacterium]